METALRLLVIDRNEGWLKSAGKSLRTAGHEVVLSTDIEEAYKKYGSEDFALVLIGLDQLERNLQIFEQWVSEKDSEKRFVVMFPIHRTLNLVRGAFRAGAHDCIDKPFNTDILADVVSKQLIRETSETQIQGVDLSARIRATRSKKRKKGDDFDDNY